MSSSFNSDLAGLGSKIPADKALNESLCTQVKAGCEKAREQMILANLGLVVSIVNQYVGSFPQFRYLWDDLISQGSLDLARAVTNIPKAAQKIDSPVNYLFTAIHRSIGKAIDEEQAIPVPARSRRRKLADGVDIRSPKRDDDIDLFIEYNDSEADSKFFYDPRKMQELRQTLDDCCETETDREILRLREEGYVDREIADILDLPLTTTYVMRRALYAKFLELSEWKGVA